MIRIITDSTCEILPEEAIKLNIDIIPCSVAFDNISYKDKIDIDNKTFYEKLETCTTLPVTSQPSPYDFYEVFKKYQDDQIIGLFLSSKLSGTFQSALIAKDMFDKNDNIHLIDTFNLTVANTLLVNEAIKLRDKNSSVENIVNHINDLIPRIKLIAYVDTIKYLKMGGRVSGMKALLAQSLSLSPIIGIEDGLIVNLDKARGKKKANTIFEQFIEKYPVDTNYEIAYAHANCIDDLNKLMEILALPNKQSINEIGPVIGTHTGPKAYGIAYITTK